MKEKMSRNKSGFILVEVIISLILISIFFIHFFVALKSSNNNYKRISERQQFNIDVKNYIEYTMSNGKLPDTDTLMVNFKNKYKHGKLTDVRVEFIDVNDMSIRKEFEFTYEEK